MASSDLALVSDTMDVRFDPKNATIQSLLNPSDRYGTNFVLSARQAPEFDVEDSRFFGDIVLHAKRGNEIEGSTLSSGRSRDVRSISCSNDRVIVAYRNDSKNDGGFKGLAITETFALSGRSRDVLEWSVEISNETSISVELEDVGFPMPMNSYWDTEQTINYERSVHRHSFVAMHGSYIYWQRPNGDGPMLVLLPDSNTSLEFKHRYRDGEGLFGERLPKWEGLCEYYIHSKHIARARADKARQYLSATSLTLAPGQSRTYGFTLRWASNYQGLRDAVYLAGGFDIISLPGMVIPMDTTVLLAVRSTDSIVSVTSSTGEAALISSSGLSNGYSLFRMAFHMLGETFVTIATASSRVTILQYYSIEPIEALIQRRSKFLAEQQLAKNDRGYNGAFLQWDMTRQKLITWHDYPGGGWKPWMAGGSDDMGLAPAAYLSEKCLVFPVQSEVDAIDYHIDTFLLQYLLGTKDSQGNRTFQVYRWYDGHEGAPEDTGIWRAYNYTHIANTFFNMYRIAKTFSLVRTRQSPLEYLQLAYELLNAMYSKIPLANPIGDAANTLGLMGESTVPDILDALASEGLVSQATHLEGFVDRKVRYFEGVKYPFASEMSIDTTGFEAVYTFSKLTGNNVLVEKSQQASMASRGMQPLWYYYGSDNRMMGESYWNLGYETQLGAWQQQDYLIHYSDPSNPDFADSLRSTYGAYLGGWANINSGQIEPSQANIGSAAWLWQSEGGGPIWDWLPVIGGWWAWSGEADLGFWGGLRAASLNVVHDPVVGLYAYGGDVQLVHQAYLLTPKDGARQRFTLFCLRNLTARVEGARYTRAIVAKDGSSLELSLQEAFDGPCNATVTLLNAPGGQYTLSISGENGSSEIWIAEGGPGVFHLPKTSNVPSSVLIRRKVE